MLTPATATRVCPGVSGAEGGPRRLAAMAPATGAVALAWLGQAGFLVRTASHTIMIDPYLSDFLAKQYRGREFPHERLVPAPLDVAEIDRRDFVLCTHRHSDHMDPDRLAEVAARHPACRFVIPAADVDHARSLGLPATLGRLGSDCAISPVNDRDEFRSARGVPGNMWAAEAIALRSTAGIPLLMPCHFGMFAFNTATAADLAQLRACESPRTLVPDLAHHFVLKPVHPSQESQ